MKFFIEIGVANFNTLYPLIQGGWKGIMVDPMRELLSEIPDHPNLIKEFVAIHNKQGVEDFIKVTDPNFFVESNVQIGMSGIKNSPNPLHHPHYKDKLTTFEVPTMSLDDLIDKHQVEHINLLKVDTEGNDGVILLNYSFKILPDVIKFEHIHFSGIESNVDYVGMDQSYYTKMYNDLLFKLEKIGYVIWVEKDDVYCIR